jgi:hypothetical protein
MHDKPLTKAQNAAQGDMPPAPMSAKSHPVGRGSAEIQPAEAGPGPEDELAYLYRKMREERKNAEMAADPPGYRHHTELARTYERNIRLVERRR